MRPYYRKKKRRCETPKLNGEKRIEVLTSVSSN